MLSVVVLAHNDENSIGKTFESIKWADEIIVIDDGSSDNTKNISEKYTDKIFTRLLNGDFSAQRNFGINKARGDWVMFVDSDEIVSHNLRLEIQEVLKIQALKGINGFFLKRKDFFLGRQLIYGETSKVRLLRLARKGAGKWERPVHEIWKIKGRTEQLTSPILHNAHENLTVFINKINNYSTLNAFYLFNNGVRVRKTDILLYPIAKFILNYIIKKGFLDGTHGFIMAMIMSLHSYLTRAKLYFLYDKKPASCPEL